MEGVFHYWFLLIFKFFLWCVEWITDILLGYTYTGGSREERAAAKLYKNSAHIVTIQWKATYMTSLVIPTLNNFFYKHEKYVHPEVVLNSNNIYLMAVKKDYALFCVSEPQEDLYETKKHPFLHIAFFNHAKKLLILPTNSLHRLAEELGDPKVPVMVNFSTGRCGSTLLTQMFHRIPGVRALSEPWATVLLHVERAQKKMTQNEYKALLKSSFRLHCKIEPQAEVKWIFMKVTTHHNPQAKELFELFPNLVPTFNTRHPVPNLRSFAQLITKMSLSLYFKLGIHWRIRLSGKWGFPLEPEYDYMMAPFNFWFKNMTDPIYLVHQYARMLRIYYDTKNIYQHLILYENLSENPQQELLELFKLMGIGEEHLPKALEALKQDSQNGLFGQRGAFRQIELPDEVNEQMDSIFRFYGLPFRKDMTVDQFKSCFSLAKHLYP